MTSINNAFFKRDLLLETFILTIVIGQKKLEK